MDDVIVPNVSLHADRVEFDAPAVLAPAEGLPDIAALRFHVDFPGGRRQVVDLTSFPLPILASEAARLLVRETTPTGSYKSAGTLEHAVQALRRFAEYLDARGLTSAVASFACIRSHHLDEFEDYLYDRHGSDSVVPYRRIGPFVLLLRHAQRHGLTSGDLKDRLKIVSKRGVKNATKPREPYSPTVAEQLRTAATEDFLAAVDRITRKGVALAASGRDPAAEARGWKQPANVVWAIKHQGFSPWDAPPQIYNAMKRYREYSDSHYSAGGLMEMVHLTHDDVLACMILLSLATGLPIESVNELRADCLRNEARGFADLVYEKRRRGATAPPPRRVRVDEHLSAGALIKTIISLTREARRFAQPDEREWLFLGYARPIRAGQASLRRLRCMPDPCIRFCERHRIVDDAGARLRILTPARLRKTYKAERYQAAPSLAGIASDHTRQVHDRHYANVEALRDVHETAIASAFEQALSAALEPIVVPAGDELLLREGDGGAMERTGLTPDQARIVSSGDQDVWIASCLDHADSPFQESGSGPCRSPMWGCLSCRNAVITSSKLPALLAFLDHVLESRSRMDIATWATRFGEAHARITEQILPRFPDQEVALARTVAEAERELLWLPAELTRSS